MSIPRISIVTPSFNQARYLEATIRSILGQDYPNLEYIIIDGGSTDNSVEIIRKYDPWLAYWVSEPDRGQSHAINKGFARCTGDLITFQNSDDIYLPGTFWDVARQWMEEEDRDSLGAIVGGFYFMDEAGCQISPVIPPRIPHPGPIDLSLGHPYRLHQVATFYTRHALDAVGRWVREDLQYTMDRELLYRVSRRYRLRTVNRAYGAFRKHPESKSTAIILPFAEEFARVHLLFCNGDPREDRLRWRAAQHHRAKGYLRLARVADDPRLAIRAMLLALRYHPAVVRTRRYWVRWLEVLGWKSKLQSLLNHAQALKR